MFRSANLLLILIGVNLLCCSSIVTPACTNDLDCQKANYASCVDGYCKPCQEDSDCYNGASYMRCKPTFNGGTFCTATCSSATDCKNNLPGTTRNGLQYCPWVSTNAANRVCGFCSSSSHCAIGQIYQCNSGGDKFCQQCYVDSDCPAGQWCYAEMCSDCLIDDDCAANPDGKMCVKYIKCGCSSNSDCGLNGRTKCYNQVCRQCISNSDCPTATASKCDSIVTYVCVGCLSNSDCSHIANGKKCLTSERRCVQCLADSDCTGSAPRCDLTTNTCQTCLSHTDCGLFTAAQCNSGSCVACTSNTACAHTLTNLICQAGKCIQCTTDADCTFSSAYPRCNTATNECVPCLTSDDCTNPIYPVCSSNTCIGCTSNSDCSKFEYNRLCLTSQSRCVACQTSTDCPYATMSVCTTGYTCEGCSYDYQCAHISGKTHCNTKVSTCVECVSNSQCPGGKVCDSTTNTCVPCTSNLNCTLATASKCSSGVCIGCTQSSDCTQVTSNPVCLASANKCVNCLTTSDCKNPLASQCADNVCVGCTTTTSCTHLPQTHFCNITAARCVECFENTDCTDSITPQCTGNACRGCSSDSVCTRFPSTPYCNFDNGMCVKCFSDSHCSGATKKCDRYTGTCVACVSNYDCTTNGLSRCGSEKTCQPCDSNEACAHMSGMQVCRPDGMCTQCLQDSDCWGRTPFCNTTSETCVRSLLVITGEEGCTPLVQGSVYLINYASVHTVVPLVIASFLDFGSSLLLRVILDQQIYYFATFLNSPSALYTDCLMKKASVFPFSFNTNINFLNFSLSSEDSTGANETNTTNSSNSASSTVVAESSTLTVFDLYNMTSRYPENSGGEISLLLILVGTTIGIWVVALIIKKIKKEKTTHRYPIEVFFRWNLVLTVLLTDQSDLFFSFLRQITGNHSENPSGAFDYGLSATGALAVGFSLIFTIYQLVHMKRSVEEDHDDERLDKYFWGVVLMDDYKHSNKLEFFYIPIMILRNALVAALVVVAQGSYMFQSVCLLLIMTLSIAYMIRVKPLKSKRDLILQTLLQVCILIDAASKIAMAASDPLKSSSKLDSISLISIITSYGVVGCAMALMAIRMVLLGLFLQEKLQPLCERRRRSARVTPIDSSKKPRAHILDGLDNDFGNSYITPPSQTQLDDSPSKVMNTRSLLKLNSKKGGSTNNITFNDGGSPETQPDEPKMSRNLSRAAGKKGTIASTTDIQPDILSETRSLKGSKAETVTTLNRDSPLIEDLDRADSDTPAPGALSLFTRKLAQRGTLGRIPTDVEESPNSHEEQSAAVTGLARRLKKRGETANY